METKNKAEKTFREATNESQFGAIVGAGEDNKDSM
jgi:hypothetical protein